MSQATVGNSSGGSGSGIMVLLDTQNVSGVSEVVFTDITTAYNDYYLSYSGVQSASTNFFMQFSTDGGGTWLNVTYDNHLFYEINNLGVAGGYSSADTQINLANGGVMTTTATAHAFGYIELYNLTANLFRPSVFGEQKITGDFFDSRQFAGSYYGGVVLVDALKLYVDSSTLDGKFTLYGIVP